MAIRDDRDRRALHSPSYARGWDEEMDDTQSLPRTIESCLGGGH